MRQATGGPGARATTALPRAAPARQKPTRAGSLAHPARPLAPDARARSSLTPVACRLSPVAYRLSPIAEQCRVSAANVLVERLETHVGLNMQLALQGRPQRLVVPQRQVAPPGLHEEAHQQPLRLLV